MVQLLHTTVHKTLKQAATDELPSRNVAAMVKALRSAAKEIVTLGPAQARTFLKTARGYKLEALYGLAVTSSMRQGELLSLRWEDKYLNVGTVQVRWTRWRMLSSSGLQYDCNKSGARQHRGFCSYPTPILNSACKQRKRAEREGFEPSRRLNTAYAISNRAPSANSDTSPRNAAGRVYQTARRALRVAVI